MAKKKPARSATKAKPAKSTKGTGGGGEQRTADAAPDMDSSGEKKSALLREAGMSSRIETSERRKLLNELLVEIDKDIRTRSELSRGGLPDCLRIEQTVEALCHAVAKRDIMLRRLRMHLYRALNWPTLPNSSGGIHEMLRRAPTAWHIRTTVEEAVDVLIQNARRKERQSASMQCLGEIARLLQTGLKLQAKRSRQVREALEHPAYIEALNRPPPKRTRGGTGGNDSQQVVFTWTEMTIVTFDKHFNPDYDPIIYGDTENYINKFMVFAKEEFDREKLGWAESLVGKKARTNNNKPGAKPKQSFSLFKREIERNARQFLAGWQKGYAPVWVFKDKSPDAEA